MKAGCRSCGTELDPYIAGDICPVCGGNDFSIEGSSIAESLPKVQQITGKNGNGTKAKSHSEPDASDDAEEKAHYSEEPARIKEKEAVSGVSEKEPKDTPGRLGELGQAELKPEPLEIPVLSQKSTSIKKKQAKESSFPGNLNKKQRIAVAAAFLVVIIAIVIVPWLIKNPLSGYIGRNIVVTVFRCNMRETPSFSENNVIKTLDQLTIGKIVSAKKVSSTLWYQVNTGNGNGWVSSKVCRIPGDNQKGKMLGVLKRKRLNLMEMPRADSRIIEKIKIGDLVTILNVKGPNWHKISTQSGNTGYARSKHIRLFRI